MDANADIQVWWETLNQAQPSIIVPYVKSAENDTIHYSIRAVKQGSGGYSEINQSGVVAVSAGTPTPLSRLQISRKPGDDCQLEVSIRKPDDAQESVHHTSSCPE